MTAAHLQRFIASCCHAIGGQDSRPEGYQIMMWKSGRGTPPWFEAEGVSASAGSSLSDTRHARIAGIVDSGAIWVYLEVAWLGA